MTEIISKEETDKRESNPQYMYENFQNTATSLVDRLVKPFDRYLYSRIIQVKDYMKC